MGCMGLGLWGLGSAESGASWLPHAAELKHNTRLQLGRHAQTEQVSALSGGTHVSALSTQELAIHNHLF